MGPRISSTLPMVVFFWSENAPSPMSSVAHLVFEVDGGVEVGDLGVDGFADKFSFGSVQEFAHFCPRISPEARLTLFSLTKDLIRGSIALLLETTSTWSLCQYVVAFLSRQNWVCAKSPGDLQHSRFSLPPPRPPNPNDPLPLSPPRNPPRPRESPRNAILNRLVGE